MNFKVNKMNKSISKNYQLVVEKVRETAFKVNRASEEITIVAVSKTKPISDIESAMKEGVTHFGENYVQELIKKSDVLNQKVQKPIWHFIGHLQSNKVKYIAAFVDMIQTIDSMKLAIEISKAARKYSRTIDCLIQVNTSGEASKYGCEPDRLIELTDEILKLPNINICGLMTIGSFSVREIIVRNEFRMLFELREKLKEKYPEIDWRHLSMGMSGDYHWAIEEGSTIIRVGTSIFGAR